MAKARRMLVPECHHCQLNGTPSPLCMKCQGPPETNHRGRTFVSFDSGDPEQTGAEVEAAMQRHAYHPPTVEEIALPDCCADTARLLLGVMLQLDDAELALLRHRLAGGSLADFGDGEQITRQAAHARWKAMTERHPTLAGVF